MRSSRRYTVIGKFLAGLTLVAAGTFIACNNNQGDTDGGQAADDLGFGQMPVSDGGFGASLQISLHGRSSNLIEVGEIIGFFVEARDPAGQPLAFRRVFCESELGIAILEPSSGGVAFEHTGEDGRMSGKLGGVTQGSYIVECRLEQGFNLVDRVTIRVSGEGAAFFPGAAGGNLGGGNLVPGAATGPTGLTGATGGTGSTGATGSTGGTGT